MDVFMASLRSACSLRRGHFVNNLRAALAALIVSVLCGNLD
ncbi:gluconate 5-dehydrogenase [Yersinia wautersii]|nr:gluconate 5-dehydrogenase [Yersinia wautersii]